MITNYLQTATKLLHECTKKGCTKISKGHFHQHTFLSTALVVDSTSEETPLKNMLDLISTSINLGLTDFFICSNMGEILSQIDIPHVKNLITKDVFTLFNIPAEASAGSDIPVIRTITLKDNLRYICIDNGLDDYWHNLSFTDILVTQKWQ